MEGLVKRLLKWDDKAELKKRELRRRFARVEYRSKALVARVISVVPLPLTVLLKYSRSDKHQENLHRYGYAYAHFFRPFRFKNVRVLEIGIGGYDFYSGGESLLAWRAYFPFARIVGCDIEPKPEISLPGAKIYQLDQSSVEDLERLTCDEGSFDIIIDDGSHLSKHQLFTFETLFPKLNEDGLYIIEDVMTSHWSFGSWDGAPVGSLAFEQTCVGYFVNLARYLNFDEFEENSKVPSQVHDIVEMIGSIYIEKNLIVITKTKKNRSYSSLAKLRRSGFASQAASAI